MTPKPRLSVLIPLFDYRVEAGFFDSWTSQQGVDPDDYELVVVSHSGDPRLDQQIRARLRPQDRFISAPGGHLNRAARYNLGAEAAAAGDLFLTEDHCLGKPGCVRRLLSFFADSRAVAGWVEGDTREESTLGQAEANLSADFIINGGKTAPWKLVQARGFAVRKECFLGLGGLPTGYGEFGATALGIHLHQLGIAVHRVPGIGVTHVNHHSLRGFIADATKYFAGEVAYRRDFPASHCVQFMEQREAAQQAAAEGDWRHGAEWRAACSLLRQCLGGDTPRAASQAWQAAGLLVSQSQRRLVGGPESAWRCRLALEVAKLRWRVNRHSESRRNRSMQALWAQIARYARVRSETRLGPAPAGAKAFASGAPIDQVPCENLYGFYASERHGGRAFRWTGPTATIGLPIGGTGHTISIDTLGLRGDAVDFPIAIVLGGRTLTRRDLSVDGGVISFRAPAEWLDAGVQWLTLATPPIRFPGDTRRLGLPIASVAWSPAAATAPSRARIPTPARLAAPRPERLLR
ncbi:MAG: hypothetical protein AAF790_10015 [Planctomycetota bacterium]